jgi:DNA repair exonuclease SbcCD ATPase subunit
MNVIAEKKYGQLTDDAPKLELAEKAIASLRQRMTSIEEEGARNDQLAGVADQLASLEGEHKKITKKLLVRCATTAVLLKKETARADELAGKVAALESTLENLVSALRESNAIG